MISELIDPAILGFILVGVMLFAIFVGFPISFTLIFLGFVFGYRIWKISFLFNDATIFHGNDRANPSSSSTICIYGDNDGTSWFNGKIIFCFSINAC